MRDRLAGLARRFVAYAVMVVAVIILLRILIGGLIGFFHMLVFMAVFVFAIYAFFWARRFKRSA
jgi:hypothetical protein